MANPRLTKLLPWAALLVMGALWGLSFSLARSLPPPAAPFRRTFWQSVVCGVILLGFTLARRRPLTLDNVISRSMSLSRCLAPRYNSLFYFAAPYVQAGVLSITVTLIPIITYAVATIGSGLFGCQGHRRLRRGRDHHACRAGKPSSRAAMPGSAGLPQRRLLRAGEHLPLAAVAAGYRPGKTACGMNLFAAAVLPIALGGQMFMPSPSFGTLEWTIIGLGLINAVAYTTFIMIRLAGPLCQPDRICRDACRRSGASMFGEPIGLGLGIGRDDDAGTGARHAAPH